ncbi:hypothetical protein [Weissella confusa]|uniref:Uncharacterized protein n=1 Tax=Weissella confusa TaxID=1583 RepID=A0A4Z0RWZ7_WEICO|nr:hypothetical protein [Weissella confusa]TGE71023.1 hypothetical protein C6P11_09540 [Weissella confusa]
MQRATKLALLVAVAGTTLTTTTGFAGTATQNIPNTTTATSVADSAISEPSAPDSTSTPASTESSVVTSEAVDEPLFIVLPSSAIDSVAPAASVTSASTADIDSSAVDVVTSSETDLNISLPAVLPGEKSLLTSATSAASSVASGLPSTDLVQLMTDISIVDNGSQATKPAEKVVEAVGSDATTPSEDAGNKVQVSTNEKAPVSATTSTHSQSTANATNVSETNGDVIKTSIHVVPAQQTDTETNSANVPSVKTPSSTEKNIAPDQGNQTINVVQTVAVKASNLADDVLPKAAYQFAWTPIAFVVVVVTIAAWAVAYYTILRRQKMREYQILMHD